MNGFKDWSCLQCGHDQTTRFEASQGDSLRRTLVAPCSRCRTLHAMISQLLTVAVGPNGAPLVLPAGLYARTTQPISATRATPDEKEDAPDAT